MTTEAEMVKNALENDTVLDVLCMQSGLSVRQVVKALDELQDNHPPAVPPMGEKEDIFIELSYQLYYKFTPPFGLGELSDVVTATTQALQKLEADARAVGVCTPERVRYLSFALVQNEGDQHGTN